MEDKKITDEEKKVLSIMFKMFDDMLEVTKEIEIDGEYFSSSDLFRLAEKFEIDY